MGKLLKRNSGRRLSGGQWIESLETRTHLAVDLSGAISFVSPASHQVKPGQSVGVAVVGHE